jgi:hypothetical protein
MSNFVETWKGIAMALGRSERWCRYMARRASDPLPVFKVGGIVRLNHGDLEDWLGRQRASSMRISDLSISAAPVAAAIDESSADADGAMRLSA